MPVMQHVKFPTQPLQTIYLMNHTASFGPLGMFLLAVSRLFSISFSSAELYDPATGTFTSTGNLVVARFGHTATSLPNGKVLIAGGISVNGTSALANAELYDPASGSFAVTGNLVVPQAAHAAALLPNGKVLLVGPSE